MAQALRRNFDKTHEYTLNNGGCGLLLGACITALCMKATGKRRENKANVTA